MNLTGGSLEIRNRKWIMGHLILDVCVDTIVHTHTHTIHL